MYHWLYLAAFLLIALWVYMKRAGIRAINRHSDYNVYAHRADANFVRLPKSRPFSKKGGLR